VRRCADPAYEGWQDERHPFQIALDNILTELLNEAASLHPFLRRAPAAVVLVTGRKGLAGA
jgi:predicted RNase H-like nuclease (RuvC/YqgF family)